MSSDTLPISPAAFSEAIKDLPISTLHLKAAELRNSIAHLDYSNEQLKPFAEGTDPSSSGPDPDCVDAIQENEAVVKRMEERISLLKKEVEDRGASWTEFQTAEELNRSVPGEEVRSVPTEPVNGTGETRSSAWTDGTFQTGRIVNGEVQIDGDAAAQASVSTSNGVNGTSANGVGGRIGDEALRRAMEDRMRDLATEDEEEGMHL